MMILLLSAIAKISIDYIREVLIPELEKKRVGALQRTRYTSPTTGKKQVMNIFLKAASFDFYWRMRVNQGCKEGEMTYWEKVSACQNFGGFETVHKAGKRPIWVIKFLPIGMKMTLTQWIIYSSDFSSFVGIHPLFSCLCNEWPQVDNCEMAGLDYGFCFWSRNCAKLIDLIRRLECKILFFQQSTKYKANQTQPHLA